MVQYDRHLRLHGCAGRQFRDAGGDARGDAGVVAEDLGELVRAAVQHARQVPPAAPSADPGATLTIPDTVRIWAT